ncbi:MAG: efflux RND transporter periplasmic adaptor subunit [Gammaproteobacteria bacterium]|nr:efflux RND transporter periplasmic adaptor subunit [Gammaproteobacteria bacterium]
MIVRARILTGLIPTCAAMVGVCLSALVSLAPEFAAAQGRTVRVTTTGVERRSVEETEWAVGIIESRSSPQMAAQVAGEIIQVLVDEGSSVSAGQLLAVINNEEYQLEHAENEAGLRRLAALMRNQELELERSQKLYADNLVAQFEVDGMEAQLEAITQELEGAKARVSESQRRLRETRLTAAVKGEIAERHIDVGDYVQTGTIVFDLIDTANLRVRLPFPEYRAPKLAKGLNVRLSSIAAGNEAVHTTITEVRPSVNPANRSLTVVIDFPNPGSWRPGASVRAEVVLEVREDAIMVPQISVVRRPAGDVVYVINAGMAEERLIERGLRNGNLVEVRAGLTGGERIAVDGAGFLTNGARVTEVEG